jgi:tetrahydromethanopterin S-methyltransferase subunit A
MSEDDNWLHDKRYMAAYSDGRVSGFLAGICVSFVVLLLALLLL